MKLFKVKKVIEFYTYAEEDYEVDENDYDEDASTVNVKISEIKKLADAHEDWKDSIPFGEDNGEKTIKEFFSDKKVYK